MEQQTGYKSGKKYFKAIHGSCCLFNLYAEYIVRNAGLDEAQAGIKIARRNISNLRYADITTLMAAAAAAKSPQLCPTLCDPIDGSPPGSPVPGILQARTLEWVAISFSNAWKWKVKVKSLSHVWLSATPWTAAYRLPCPWDFPGKRTGVGCHCLLWHPYGRKRELKILLIKVKEESEKVGLKLNIQET